MAAHARNCPKLPWMIDFFSTDKGVVPVQQIKAAYADNQLDYMRKLNYESLPPKKRLTGLMCTLGPKSWNVDILESMLEAGMCVARLKMCYFSDEELDQAIFNIKQACDNYSKKIGSMFYVPIALELKGPEIRTGTLKNTKVEKIYLKQGDETVITSDPSYEEHVTEDMIYVDYQKINDIVEPGDRVYIEDATLSAMEIVGSFIRCIVERAGRIGDRAAVSLENAVLDLPTVWEIELETAKRLEVDAVIVSNIRDHEMVKEIKQMLGVEKQPISVISKIEDGIGVKNIEEIIKETDCIFISRTDLAYEIPQEKLFVVQKSIIAACNKAGKPVICAPRMLASMSANPAPKNCEINDVATTIIDGIDCLVLSEETATGDFPVQTVQELSRVCREAEAAIFQREVFKNLTLSYQLFEPIYSLAIGVVESSMKCNAAAIILLTTSGRTAKVISQYRPRCPIVAITRFARVARHLRLYRGVESIHFVAKPLPDWKVDVRRRLQFGITYGKYYGFIRGGDTIIVVTGARPGTGFTNCMHMYYASDFDTLEGQEEPAQ